MKRFKMSKEVLAFRTFPVMSNRAVLDFVIKTNFNSLFKTPNEEWGSPDISVLDHEGRRKYAWSFQHRGEIFVIWVTPNIGCYVEVFLKDITPISDFMGELAIDFMKKVLEKKEIIA